MLLSSQLRDLTPEQRAFVRGVGEGYSLARKEMQHDFERRFKQLKDETNAEVQAMRATWDQQLADLQNIIIDFERKYFEGLRAASTLAAVERDDNTRLH